MIIVRVHDTVQEWPATAVFSIAKREQPVYVLSATPWFKRLGRCRVNIIDVYILLAVLVCGTENFFFSGPTYQRFQ